MFISFSNQICFEHVKAITHSLQKYISNGLLHAPIKDHLTFALRGFVVRNQIPNLTFDPSFDHNSCISYLNEKYEGNSRHVDFNTFPMVF
jgi:hypothetical protein